MIYPQLRPGVEVISIDRGRVLFRSFSGTVMFTGEFIASELPKVLAQMDGNTTDAQIADTISEEFREEFENFLKLTTGKQLLVDAKAARNGNPSGMKSHQRAYWSLFPNDPEDAYGRLQAATLLIGNGGCLASTVMRALAAAGVGRIVAVDPHPVRSLEEMFRNWEELVSHADLVVLASDNMSLAGYTVTNEACIRQQKRWVSARVDRTRGIIGPLVAPRESACFTCFELRSRANAEHPTDHEALYRHWKNVDSVPCNWPVNESFLSLIGSYLALDIQRVLTGTQVSAFLGRIFHVDLHTFESKFHELLKIPRCPSCSRVAERPLTRIWDVGSADNRHVSADQL
jgi:bacteriocin biosynthesis cyclodehydratase domain-containing protein